MKNKIIIINPPLYFSNRLPYALDVSVPPLGILYLASYINQYLNNFEAKVIDVAVDGYSLNEVKEIIGQEKPFVVGITAMTPQLQGAVELAGFLKENFKKIKIFLGGAHISADPDFINRFRNIFDYAITGEGEKTFAKSISNLYEGKDIPRIQGSEIISDLDTIPFPDRNLIDRTKYSQNESIMFSRGCPYNCYYCSRPAISRKVRYRSVDNLIKEIKFAYKYCGGKIDFQDDTFTLSRSHVLEFCAAVKTERLRLEWRCNSRIDLIDKEMLWEMKKAGCKLIHFGIESANEKVRKEIVKKGEFTNKKIYEVLQMCKKLKIKAAGYFMIGHLRETKNELNQTKKMILGAGFDLIGVSIPTPFPGSNLYEVAKSKGIISEDIIDRFARKELGEGYVGNYPIFVPERLTKEYLFSLLKYINRKFYINFRTFWSAICRDIFSLKNLKKDAKDLISLIRDGVSSRKPYKNKKL